MELSRFNELHGDVHITNTTPYFPSWLTRLPSLSAENQIAWNILEDQWADNLIDQWHSPTRLFHKTIVIAHCYVDFHLGSQDADASLQVWKHNHESREIVGGG